jgi:adenine-specific DNA-methyltransferase
LALTRKGDWVLDPYAGVGSTLIAAAMHGRRSLGSEKEREYHEIALQRLHALRNGTLRLRPLGKSVYAPTGNEKVATIPDEWRKLRAK